MKHVLMVDVEKCTGCRRCEVACSFFKENECNPAKSRIHVLSWVRESMDMPLYCVQCMKPVCEAVCPVKAIKVNEKTSTVLIDHDLCIGCRLCMMACPIGAISIDMESKKILKCDLCEGKPKCVEYCEPKALEYAPAITSNLAKMRRNAEKFLELVALR